MKAIIKKISITLLATLFLLAGCGKTTTQTSQLAEKIKTNIPALANMTTGPVSLDSILAYYTDIDTKWVEIIEAKPPREYRTGIEAQQKIAQQLKTLITPIKDADPATVEVNYIGTENATAAGNVTGIFIYNFQTQDLAAITDELITDANSFTDASQSGEYFHKKGNYIITCEYGAVENPQDLFTKIDTEISSQA